jgi:hypothetical protein
MTRKRKIRVSDAGKERRVSNPSGLYVRNVSPTEADEPETEPVKGKPSLPTLRFLEKKQIAGEWL